MQFHAFGTLGLLGLELDACLRSTLFFTKQRPWIKTHLGPKNAGEPLTIISCLRSCALCNPRPPLPRNHRFDTRTTRPRPPRASTW